MRTFAINESFSHMTKMRLHRALKHRILRAREKIKQEGLKSESCQEKFLFRGLRHGTYYITVFTF